MKEEEAREIVEELRVEFRKENERMHLHPISPGMVIGRVVFYLALFHELGLTDSLAELCSRVPPH